MFTKEGVTLQVIADLLASKGGDYLMVPRDLRISLVV